MSADAPYNPLEKFNLGASVADAMLSRPALSLGDVAPFVGAGIYALYYQGSFVAYERLAEINRLQGAKVPIYVGKAIPEGGRKGGGNQPSPEPGGRPTRALFKRLMEHAESIRATALPVDDFSCRYLVVDDTWIPLGESLLIARFSPLWNLLLDGFGNHDPGKGRYNGLVPKWDVLHPGRSWAGKCQPRQETAQQIAQEAKAWLAQAPALMQSRYVAQESEAGYRHSLNANPG